MTQEAYASSSFPSKLFLLRKRLEINIASHNKLIMRGISTLFSAVLVLIIAVALSIIVSNWLTTTFKERAEDVRDISKTKLDCQFADLYVRNITYNCNSDCTTATNHTLTITIVNSGKKAVTIKEVNILDRNGTLTFFGLNGTRELNATDVITFTNSSTTSCTGFRNYVDKVVVASTNCPKDAVDFFPGSDVVFQNC